MKALQFLIFLFTIVLITCCNSIAKESNSIVFKDNYNLPTNNITKVFKSPKAFNKDKTYKWPSDKRIIFEQIGNPDEVMENRWAYYKINGGTRLEVEFQDCCDDIKSWTLFNGCYSTAIFSIRSHSHKLESSNQLERFKLRK